MSGSASARCGTCHQVLPLADPCMCGHDRVMHDLGKRGAAMIRTLCSVTSGETGRCPCRRFVSDPEAPGEGVLWRRMPEVLVAPKRG